MKDIIWTLIVVWLIYKIIDAFRITSAKRGYQKNPHQGQESSYARVYKTSRPEKDIKDAVKKHLNNEGEYVDFEEVK